MDGINVRIKEFVDKSGMKKGDIAAKLNISQPFLSQLCAGARKPSDRTIKDICSEFGVREEWLRTGNGSMKEEKPRDVVLADELDKVITAGSEDFRKRLIAWLVRMSPERWKALEEITLDLLRDVCNLADTLDAAPPEPKNVHDWTDAEMHAELQRQLDAEKRETGESSTGSPNVSGADCA